MSVINIPAHIPPHLVVDFDIYGPLPPGQDTQQRWVAVRDQSPEVFWTARNGGHWIATRAREIERIQLDHETFSHEVIGIPRETAIPLFPLTLDPPRHGPFRRLINTAFTPRAVATLENKARDVARGLVTEIAPRGGCEFVAEFARVLPIAVFLDMVDLPDADRPDLLHWTEVATRSADIAERHAANTSMLGYLGRWITERSATLGDDLLSHVAQGKVEGRNLTPEETMSVSMLLLFGGLDTVASMLGFVARFLALNPAHRQLLVEDRALIPQAIEELLRRHGIANTARLVKSDVEIGGVRLRRDEMILIPNCLVGLDDRIVQDPLKVDFYRSPIRMGTFGNGPHLCPGALLARRELRVFLEEWLAVIPDFGVRPGTEPVIEAGMVGGVTRLELAW